MDLLKKIEAKDFTITVVGIGRVGLPLAISFANAGVKTYGLDINAQMVQNLIKNVVPFKEDNLENQWEIAKREGNLFLSLNYAEAIPRSDVVIICVGTPLTGDLKTDLSPLMNALNSIVKYLEKETLLILRSTLPPRTTTRIIIPFLKEKAKFQPYLAVCPERIMEGHAFRELKELPEIIGTVDEKSAELAEKVFKILNENKVIIRTDPSSAELAKLFSNVYRYINFALANELAILADELGLNAREIIRIANYSYKRGGIPKPGPSSGPCLFKDGHFLTSRLPYIDFIRMAWHLNESVPSYIVERIRKAIGALYGISVGVLGLAYKAGSDDTRYSPAVKIVELLRSEGCIVHVHDPNIPTTENLDEVLKSEILVIAVNHPEFSLLSPEKFSNTKLIYDCWGILEDRKDEFSKLGCTYISFGGGMG